MVGGRLAAPSLKARLRGLRPTDHVRRRTVWYCTNKVVDIAALGGGRQGQRLARLDAWVRWASRIMPRG